jgi:subtilisin family serine protease
MVICAVATWLVLWSVPAMAGEVTPPDEVIVKYRSDASVTSHGKALRKIGRSTEVLRIDDPDWSNLPHAKKWERLRTRLEQLKQDPNVLYAEPNYRGHFEEVVPVSVPNDTSYGSQWWLPAVGDRTMWAVGAGTGVVVAVVDSGVDMSHPDLVANLLSNGYNFGDGNANPQDYLGHGTAVAGVIAAAQNNGIGVSGLAPGAKLLPIKVSVGFDSSFTSDVLALGIDYAVSQGARVINLSLTVPATQTVQDAIQRALNQGVVVVAAAGNDSGAVAFPANMAGVVAVAATDETANLLSTSNWGPEITVAAPGSNIYTTDINGMYRSLTGTSIAAPVVSAAVADIMSLNPSLPVASMPQYLREYAGPIGGGSYTFGVLDAGKVGANLVPVINLPKQQFSQGETLSVSYALPPTGGTMDIYVAVQTPSGEFFLRPDGTWGAVAQEGYLPIATGYQNAARASGVLFGSGGLFSAITLVGLPLGAYNWRVGYVDSLSGRLIGTVVSSMMQLQ